MQIFIFERALLSQIKLYFHVCLWTTIGLQIVLVSQTSVTMNSTNPLHLALGGTVATITVRENNEPKIAILYLFVVLVPLTASEDIDMFCCLAPCSREALIMRFNLWNSWSLLSWGEATTPPPKNYNFQEHHGVWSRPIIGGNRRDGTRVGPFMWALSTLAQRVISASQEQHPQLCEGGCDRQHLYNRTSPQELFLFYRL